MNSAVVNYFVTILFALVAVRNCTLPEYIHVCHKDDPQLADCITNSIEELRPRLVAGIESLDVPPLEPFLLDILSFKTSAEGTHLASNITNVKVWGPSDFKLLKLTPTLTKNGNTFRFEAIIPQLRIEGDYEIDSKILVIELRGKGPFHCNISDFHFECVLKGHKIQKESQNYLEFENMKCNLVVGKVFIFLENLFDGNPILGKATNEAINDNANAFFEEFKPSLVKAIEDKFTNIANKITFSSFTYEELFP